MRAHTFLALVVASAAIQGCTTPSDDPAAAPAAAPVAAPPVRGEVHLTFASGDTNVTRVQWGEPFALRIDGLLPGEEVMLVASSKLSDGGYRSEAMLVADAAGSIDTTKSASARGAYTGVDADGLVWSMEKTSTALPAAPQYAFHVEANAADGTPLGSATLARWYGKDIPRVEVGTDGLIGAYYAPPGATKLPVIVTFGGSEGGLESGESAALYWASRGYAALGLAYFAAPGLPYGLTEVPLEYFEKAFAWLDRRPEVDASRLAVMGGSRGGELALLLGATFPRVKAVVANVPSGLSWGAPKTERVETASWTFRGEKLAFVPYSEADAGEWTLPSGEKAAAMTPAFRAALAKASPAVLEAASFAVEKTNGPVLLLAGQDDQLWPSCELAKRSMERLTAHGHDKRFPDAFVCYPDSGHASTGLPGIPTTLLTSVVHPLTGEFLAMGGKPQAIARAQRDALARTDAFLAASLR